MDIFSGLKSAIKLRQVLVDNEVFQLHYRVTALLLLGCAALVASKQHFGDPIDCITRDDVPNKIMDTYCWIHSTFTLPNSCNKTVGFEVAHPCVSSSGDQAREERVFHKYYQWVYFVLFFQAACFYAPHQLWKTWESRLLSTLAADLKCPIEKDSDKEEEKRGVHAEKVALYLFRHQARHQKYFYSFTICETLNLLNVVGQIYLVDAFLGGTFTTYGLEVINYSQMDQEYRVDPMVKVFPRMTKCTFHRFGASGDVQRYDALCILPLNIINEKIFIVMWFWFVFLGAVTSLWLVYRYLTFTRNSVRHRAIMRRANFTDEDQLNYVLKNMKTGDWFLISMICKNVNSLWFDVITRSLSRRIQIDQQEKRKKKKPERRPNNYRRNGNEPMISDDSDDSDKERRVTVRDHEQPIKGAAVIPDERPPEVKIARD